MPSPTCFDRHIDNLHRSTIRHARGVYGHYMLGTMTKLISKGKLCDAIMMSLIYMRWLDDVADESDMSNGNKKKLLEDSLSLLKRCRSEDFDFLALNNLRIEERCAYFFVKDAQEALRKRGAPESTVEAVLSGYTEMIRSILQDVNNMDRLMGEKEFYDKVYYLKAGVGFRTAAYVLYDNPSPKVLEAFKYFGYIWQMNNDIPDVAKDLKCGLVNMTREEVEKAGVRLKEWKGREDELAKHLEKTGFFRDRTARLQEWKKIVEAGLPEMDSRIRFLVKRYLRVACPKRTFDSSSVHYKVIRAGDGMFRRGRPELGFIKELFFMLPLFVPESALLVSYNLFLKRIMFLRAAH